jgi:hypothetical protein
LYNSPLAFNNFTVLIPLPIPSPSRFQFPQFPCSHSPPRARIHSFTEISAPPPREQGFTVIEIPPVLSLFANRWIAPTTEIGRLTEIDRPLVRFDQLIAPPF